MMSPSKLEQLISPEEKTFLLFDIECPNTPVFTLTSTRYIEKDFQKITKFCINCSSRYKQVAQNQALKKSCLKSDFRTSTIANSIQSANISASNMKIILPPPVPLSLLKYFLPLFSFMAGLAFARISTSYGTRPPMIFYPGISSKPSFKRVLETLDCL